MLSSDRSLSFCRRCCSLPYSELSDAYETKRSVRDKKKTTRRTWHTMIDFLMSTTRRGNTEGVDLMSTMPRDVRERSILDDYYPAGDPRVAARIPFLPEFLVALGESKGSKAYLSTDLLDILLHEGAGKPPSSSSNDGTTDKPVKLLGSTGTRNNMVTYLELLHQYEQRNGRRDISHIVTKVRRMCSILAEVFALTGVEEQLLIIPIVEDNHFFVVVVKFDKRTSPVRSRSAEKFISKVMIYDSFCAASKTTTRGAKKEDANAVIKIVHVINNFVNEYILQNSCYKMLRQTDEEVVQTLSFYCCPQQQNSIDCGLFCVGVVLHLLLDDRAVDSTIFHHTDVSEMRKRLYTHFAKEVKNRAYTDYVDVIQQPTSVVVRDSYPLLKGTPRASDIPTGDLDELVLEAGRLEEELRSTTSSLVDTATPSLPDVTAASSIVAGTSTLVEDNAFETLFPDKSVVFACLEEIQPVVDSYQQKTGLRLCIWKSKHEKYRYYKCKSHVNYPFEIRLGSRRSDGFFRFRVHNNKHSAQRVPAVASNGRQYKARRADKLNIVIADILNTKKEPPTPGDIMHATKDEKLPYMSAWRVLNVQSALSREDDKSKYELVMPYVEEFRRLNPGAAAGYTRDEELRLRDVHIFPPFMDESLKHVSPVICLDAAHLNSRERGTLYVVSCLSGANEVYPIGFMISKGNEDGATWTKMLRLLHEACPSLSVHEPNLEVRRYTGEEY